MPDTASGMPSSATTKLVLTVLFLLIAILFVTNPDFRTWAYQTMDEVYSSITCVFLGEGCFSGDDDQTAIDSTKALACAIDATAYWSDASRATALAELLKRIDNPDAICKDCHSEVSKNPPTLFRDTNGNWIGGCREGTSTPTGVAVGARTGGIISALSELSGGGNRITGNAIATGTCKAEADGTYYVLGSDSKKCGTKILTDAGHKVCDPASGCLEVPCPDCKKGGLLDPCPKEECAAISNTQKYGQCKWTEGITGNECKLTQTKAQAKAASFTDADAIVRENPGKAVRFGKTAVLCGKKTINSVCCQIASEITATYGWRNGGCTGVDESGPVADALCTGEKPGATSGGFSCSAIGFELPQHIEGDAVAFAAKWLGIFGEPRYIVYHETFPTGVEGMWVYEGMDAVISAAAVGGVLNIAGGALKGGAAGIKKTAQKGAEVVITFVKRGDMSAVLSGVKSGVKSAVEERITLEYGGKAALNSLAARKVAYAFHGSAQVGNIMLDNMEEAMIREGEAVAAAAGRESVIETVKVALSEEMKDIFIADMSLAARSSEEVSEDTLKVLLDESNVKGAMGWSDTEYGQKVKELSDEIKGINSKWKSGKLLNDAEKSALKKRVDEEVIGTLGESAAVRSLVEKSAKNGLWYFKGLRAFLNTPGYQGAAAKAMKGEVEEVAKLAYEDVLKTTYDLSLLHGDEFAEQYVDDIYTYTYDNIESFAKVPGNFKDAVQQKEFKDAFDALATDASSLLKGMTGQKQGEKLLSLSNQRKVMATTLAISYFAMVKDANIEKYKSCGQGKTCLHMPKWFVLQREWFSDMGSTTAYGSGKDVAKSFNDLVSITFGAEETLRMHMMSPCKADVEVKASDTACKCETFYGRDRIAYRFDKMVCVLDLNGNGLIDDTSKPGISDDPKGDWIPVDLESNTKCPKEYDLKEDTPVPMHGVVKKGKYRVLARYYDPRDVVYTGDIDFSPVKDCPVSDKEGLMDTLQKCVDNKIHDKDGDVKNEYSQCYDVWGGCEGGLSGIAPAPNFLKFQGFRNPYISYLNVVPVPLNILPSVDSKKPAETIAVCENSWMGDILSDPETRSKKCITVTPNPASMKTYSDEGFGVNFCAENKASFAANLEAACFWGTIAISAGAEIVTGGGATPLLFVVGSGGAACEKLATMESKWPKNQY